MSKTYLAYIDESGSDGAISNGGSKTFTLGCVLIDAEEWPSAFDGMIAFRRFLRDQYKIPVRAELKANYLIRNGGPLRPLNLSEAARFSVYRGLLRLQDKLKLKTFAVVIRKDLVKSTALNCREVAWEFLIQRLERFTTNANHRVMIFHDEGEGNVAMRLVRKARRIGSAGSAFGAGRMSVPARFIIDDTSSRKSHESYFIQLADLNAYAAYRAYYPPPDRRVHIVPEKMWDELGNARLAAANGLLGGIPGIVVWPKS